MSLAQARIRRAGKVLRDLTLKELLKEWHADRAARSAFG